ncbi:adenylyltransferase/cytidyltransferase family protein [Anaeromyxobacter terrae]|uniref:adenylyltransferase/cytidyltransferase family protein n=1 Tax=Anaeromyxobacter terrae TaxID=2925406 RepID=UPI002FCCBEB6
MARNVITYGTFDMFHVGHLRLLQRLRNLGDRLIVAVSTDEFNAAKNKKAIIPYEGRAEIVGSLKIVDQVIPEHSWDQKAADIKKYDISVFGIGDDWSGKFDHLKVHCEVVYLPRTPDVSSSALRRMARALDPEMIERLREVHAVLDQMVRNFE